MGSWAAADRVVKEHGPDDVILLFTDTRMEDDDLYRFLTETAAELGCELRYLADGRDPWQVYKDRRFLGNHRIDPCSRILKRELSRKWVDKNCEPDTTTLYIGIDWSEIHRMEAVKRNWMPYNILAPMMEQPYFERDELMDALVKRGIQPPLLTRMGFAHNNCGGFCCKAGQASFKMLLDKFPDRYAYHEQKEQEMRDFLGKDVAFLTNRRDGKRVPETMKQFRMRMQDGEQYDFLEFGGCGCFVDSEIEDEDD